jgi:hypothetical protein
VVSGTGQAYGLAATGLRLRGLRHARTFLSLITAEKQLWGPPKR